MTRILVACLPRPAPRRAASTMAITGKHVLIVGGGVIGLATAYYCLRRGHRVTLLERGTAQHDCCSRHNAGMIVPSHFIPLAAPGAVALAWKWMGDPESPFHIRPRLDWDLVRWGWRFMRSANAGHVARSAPALRDLAVASRALFLELADLPGHDFGLVKKGLLMLCQTQQALDEEAHTATRARELGLPAEVLDREGTAAREPGVTMEVSGSVFFPLDCHLAPERFLATLQRLVEEGGGQIAWETDVEGWKTERGRVTAVVTRYGTVSADEFVLCGGSWSSQVVRSLGLRLPLQPGRGYSLTLATPRQRPATCAILTEARIAVTPIGSALRFGGTMEIAGLDAPFNPARVRGIIKAIPAYYPAFQPDDFNGITPWSGLRPVSPDGLPYLGRSRRFTNLCLATGHAMMGLSLAPITGSLLAQVISEERPAVDLSLFEPERFG